MGEIEPITLRVGTEIDFESVLVRLVEMAYTRVDMVGKRGEFAVRGGILDLFSPTADHPVRIEFWGDEVSELRYFSVADQRSLPEIDVDLVIAPPCRELLLTQDVRDRAAAIAAENQADASLVEMLDKISAGIPVEGMEALLPVLKPGELQLLSDVLPAGTHILLCDPEKVRTRATDLVRTGQEFLEASWTAASIGGAAPLDTSILGGGDSGLGASAYRSLRQVRESAEAGGRPWWSVSLLASGSGEELELPIQPAPQVRGSDDLLAELFVSLRAHVTTGGRAAVVVAGAGTAKRVLERLGEAEVPATMAEPGAVPPAVRSRSCVDRCTTVWFCTGTATFPEWLLSPNPTSPAIELPRWATVSGCRPSVVTRWIRLHLPRATWLFTTSTVSADLSKWWSAPLAGRGASIWSSNTPPASVGIRGPVVRAHGIARSALALRGRRAAGAEQTRRIRLGEHKT